MPQASTAPFRMPEAWHGKVPAHYQGQRRAPFNSFDTFVVVNKTTSVAVQGESCPGRAGAAAEVMSAHNARNGHNDRYGVVRVPDYLCGKTAPENWQQLLDQNN